MKLILSAVAILAVASATTANAAGVNSTINNPCAAFLDCESCIRAAIGCGWCSYPIEYQGGITGPQCAGTQSDTTPFTCPAIFSRFTCIRGYQCTSSGCGLAPPGQGQQKDVCEQNCKPATPAPAAQIYGCNPVTKQCQVVPPGTPGAGSLQLCEVQCKNISTIAPGPVQKTYICNVVNFTCDPTTPGHGASQEVCESTCTKDKVGYQCNLTSYQCYAVPPPAGSSQAQCQSVCTPSSNTPLPTLPPAPGPPPEYLGLWRGVEIQNSYRNNVEWDMKINITTVVIVQTLAGGQKVVQYGTPFHKANSATLEFWILITSGPGTGTYIRSVGDATGERGPQTTFITMALSAPGGAIPASIDAAMTSSTGVVLALTGCIVGNTNCIFYLPPGVGSFDTEGFDGIAEPLEAARRAAKAQQAQPELRLAAAGNKKPVAAKLGFNDSCSVRGTSCQTCIATGGCGWCSVDVVYTGGVTGTQCAGTTGATTPFVCQGTFSTTGCEVGYTCLSGSFKCVPSQPGDGSPLAQCLATCKPTPPPNPTVPQYVCNLATRQCTLCRTNQCPGSMPQGQCADLCAHPMPGPTPNMVGTWRGIQIQQHYPFVEVDVVLNSDGFQYYLDGVLYMSGTVISLGADVMYWDVKTGANAGKRFALLYQMATVYNGLYWQGTFAISAPGGGIPQFNPAMYTSGESELVLAKCLKAPCSFPRI